MIGRLETLAARLLALPGEPEPPPGSAAAVRAFRAARPYYRYLLVQWGAKQLGAALGLVVGFAGLQIGLAGVDVAVELAPRWLLAILEPVAIAGFLLQLPFSLLVVRLDYRYRWYLVTDRSLRIREGVLTVREQTLSFANVQNVSIRRGPLQQWLGIADLEVRTAGGGGKQGDDEQKGGRDLHQGLLRGIDDPEGIRGLILARLRRLRDSGLGDPDEGEGEEGGAPAEAAGGGAPDDLGRAAGELLAAAKALAASLEG